MVHHKYSLEDQIAMFQFIQCDRDFNFMIT